MNAGPAGRILSGAMPLRVIRIATRLNLGGPARQIEALLRRAPEGMETTVVAGHAERGEYDLFDDFRAAGLPVVRCPFLSRNIRPAADVLSLFWLTRYLKREKPDVVHTHMAKAGYVGRLAAKLAGIPAVVHTYHGFVLEGYFDAWKTRLFRRMERASARRSARLIALSPALARMIPERYGITDDAGKITVIPPAMDFARLDNAASCRGKLRAALDIPARARVIAFVGRLVAVKAPELFIEAAGLAGADAENLRFVLAGDGPLRPALECLVAEKKLRDRVLFAGDWRKDIREIYADSDLIVLSSKNEGVPITAIEALACGVPVVATSVGGLPDLITDARLGRLVPPGDVAALAAAIVTSFDDADREFRMKFVRDRYDAGTAAETHRALYHEILDHGNTEPDHGITE
ncbi:MAG: glycosyltransferase [Planctomycetota bacterium]